MEDDPALDNISRFAFTSIRDDLFQLHFTKDECKHAEHQPSAAEKQEYYAAYAGAAGMPPSWGEMRWFSKCFALTCAQAAQAEADARCAGVSPSSCEQPNTLQSD